MNHPFAARSLIDPAPGDGRSPTYGTPHGPNGDPLLSAKLSIPPVPPAYLSRNRLFELLTGATKRGVTAIHGPAGSGKTALTAGWVRAGQAPGPVAWLTLDGEDNAPGMFWTYILHALRRNASRLAPDVPAPTRPDLVDRSTLTRLATALAERAQPIVLVLDGAEQISNRSIAADLDMLVRYSTPGLRLIVVGRSARLIPLQRYQLSGELTEIDADDLALTREEAVKILRSYPANLTDDGIAHLHDSTGGWMTGVCLHALALEPGGGEPVRRPSAAGNHAIAEFLRTEVLDPQPSRVRDLLVRTSIAETVHPDLADWLTGRLDARAVTVAAGVFAPGHLGELTQYLPFELVDDILAQTKTVQRRLRDLPSRVGVYFLLALGMYPRLGYARVWAKLTAGLAAIHAAGSRAAIAIP